jgi:ABC-type sugar transport system substrate-binding protein
MNKKILGLGWILLLLFSFVACGKKNDAATNEKKQLRFAYVVKNLTNPYFVEQARGIQETCDRLGIAVEIQATSLDTEIDKQIQLCDNFLVTLPDAIIVTPLSSTAIVPFVKRCNDAGVQFVNCDGLIDQNELDKINATVLTTVAADNVTAGVEGARALIRHLNNRGKVAVLEGTAGAATAEDRKRGFEETINSEGGDIEIVALQPANYNRNMGYEVTQTILVAHPDITGLFAANAEMALGAVKAVEEAGLIDRIAIVGVYNSDEASEATLAGKMLGSIDQGPYDMGRISVEKLYDYIVNGIQPEYSIMTPSIMMYADDIK